MKLLKSNPWHLLTLFGVGALIALAWTDTAQAQDAPPPGTVVTIEGTTTLRWQAPSQNVDGSPLTDLGGYRIWFGRESRTYEAPLDVVDGSATNWGFSIPIADETDVNWYFAMTAYDQDNPAPGFQEGDPDATPPVVGDSESAYSNEVLKVLTVTFTNTAPPAAPQLLDVEMNLTCTTDSQFVTCEVSVSN